MYSSKILRDMRKGKQANATKKLNTSRYASPGPVVSHVAQGVLRNSRTVLKDHVIWNPEEQRSRDGGKQREPIIQEGGTFVSY